jgi:hypothetical protein
MDTETQEDVPLNRQTSETAEKSDSKYINNQRFFTYHGIRIQ